ncbi:LysE family transporter [Sciscionella sediminilitoris]|uniref:LysE family transporter n=1 Tax=Sciscionella sediminilitoris TaxID=1445613 RepID=UPI000B067B15
MSGHLLMGALLTGILAGYGIAIPVGAVGAYLVGLAARERFAVAASAAFGVAVVDGAYALLAVLGGAGLAEPLRPIAVPLGYLSAGALVLLAGLTLLRAVRRYRGPLTVSASSPVRAFLGLLALTAINPATLVYFLALILGRGAEGGGALFVLGALLASASWQLLLVCGGGLLGRALTGARGRLVIAIVSAVLMLVLAVAALTGGSPVG